MDIRSKNIRYSTITKAIAVFVIWASFIGLAASAFYLGVYSDDIFNKDYQMTDKFQNEFIQNIQSACQSAERQLDAEGIKKSKDLKFLIIETKTGKITTNVETSGPYDVQSMIRQIKQQSFNVHISKDVFEASFDDKNDLMKMAGLYTDNPSLEIYAAAIDPPQEGGVFYQIWSEHITVQDLIPLFAILASLSFLAGVVSFVYLLFVAGRRAKDGRIVLCTVDRIYTDVQTLMVFIALMISVSISQGGGLPANNIERGIVILIGLTVCLFIGLTYVFSLIRHIKNKTLLRHTLVYNTVKMIKTLVSRCINAKTFKVSVIIMLIGYTFLNTVFTIIMSRGYGQQVLVAFILFVVLNICALYYVAKSLVSLSDVMKWVKRIKEGRFEDIPEIAHLSPAFADFSGDIRNIQSGFKNAVTEAVKGERLKTELITNVSHDLKTPLTSIISYVDLLKNEETDNENIKEYTGILAEKSDRLKKLIDDLLEASKAASGDVTVNLAAIDLQALVLQAEAEFSDKAAETGLDLRIKAVDKAPVVHADGGLMWRILENLFTNVLKYSQKNSRVYVDMGSFSSYGMVTIKNISDKPMDVPAEQLMERFVRGDSSRTTEGSGLGLAIAKSLAEIQGGKLEIAIDGDLFKVSVFIPLENV